MAPDAAPSEPMFNFCAPLALAAGGVGHTALPIPELISRNEQNVYTFLPTFATMIYLKNSLINMLKVPKASIEKTINIGPKE